MTLCGHQIHQDRLLKCCDRPYHLAIYLIPLLLPSLYIFQIAVFLAHQIFAKTSCKSIEESDFISEWQGLIPGSGMSAPSVDLLQGVALREDGQNDGGGGKIGMEKTSHLSHFSESSLPLGPSDRLMKMFRLRDRWTIEEMAPYLNPLVEECGMSTTKMLLRYAKVVTDESGVQWYMAQKILS